MKVRVLRALLHHGKHQAVGSIIEVEDFEGRRLIGARQCEPIKNPPAAPEPEKRANK